MAKKEELTGLQESDDVHPRMFDDMLVNETLIDLRSR